MLRVVSVYCGAIAMSDDPFPVITSEDYPEFLRLPNHDFPSNHETWAHGEALQHGSAAGGTVRSVPVRPAEFKIYCEKNGLPFTRSSLYRYAYEKSQKK